MNDEELENEIASILMKNHPGQCLARDLAKQVEIDKKAVNRVLYAMERKGLVEKQLPTPPKWGIILDADKLAKKKIQRTASQPQGRQLPPVPYSEQPSTSKYINNAQECNINRPTDKTEMITPMYFNDEFPESFTATYSGRIT